MEKWLGLPVVGQYKGLDMYDLSLNHAYMIANTTVDNVGVYAVDDNCFNCPYKLMKYLKAGEEASWMVDTSVWQSWRVMKSEYHEQVPRNFRKGILCQLRPVLHEYGVYRLGVGACQVKPEVPPAESYLPLLLCSAILLVLTGICGGIKCWKGKKKTKQEKVLHINEDNNENTNNLDMFRNLLMYALIFTTTGGGGFPIFKANWGGLTIADCLYYAYIWTIGFNFPTFMEDAFNKRSKCAIVRDIFKRSFWLIFLGVVIDSTIVQTPEGLARLWWPLQRMGVAYFVAASIYALTVQKIYMRSKKIPLICKAMSTLVSLMYGWILSGFILAIIIILISTLLSFNCLANTSLRGLPDYSSIFSEVTLNCNNETSEFANRIFVAESKRMVDVNAYLGFSRGVMGIISTVMYSIIGLKAGYVFVRFPLTSDRLKLWGVWATLFGIGGVIFAGVSYPLHFNTWPISSIIVICTATLYAFAFHYILMDILKSSSEEKTSTSLLIFCGHLLFSNSFPFSLPIALNTHFVYLLQCFWIVMLWVVIGWLLKSKVKIQI